MQRYFFKFVLFCLISLSFITSFSQTLSEKYKAFESEKNPIMKSYRASVLAIKYIQENDDSVRYFKNFAEKHVKIGTLSEAGVLQIEIQEAISSGDASEFLDKAIRARKIYEKYKISREVDAMGIAIGFICSANGDFPKSSAEYIAVYNSLKPKVKDLSIADETDKINYNVLISHLSYLYYTVGEFDKSIRYNLETEHFTKETNDLPNYAFAISNTAATYVKMKKYDEAIAHYMKSLKIRETVVAPSSMGYDEYCLAWCYMTTNDQVSALKYINIAIAKRDEYKNDFLPRDMINNLLGNILQKMGRNSEAIPLCLGTFNSALANREEQTKRDACKCLKNAYSETGNFKEAFKYLAIQSDITDTINLREKNANIEVRSKFLNLENTRYQDSLKIKEAAEYKNLKYFEQNKTIKRTNIGLILLSLMLCVLLVTFYFVRKSNVKNNVIAEKVKASLVEKEVLLKEIHHRVKNNFQVISSLLNIQANSLQNDDHAVPLREAQNRILSMALVHQKLYGEGGSYSHIKMQPYFVDLIEHYSHMFFTSKEKLKVTIEAEKIELDLERAVPLGLLSNEVITNAMKYGKSDDGTLQLSISMKEESENYIITFADKGAGFSNIVEDNPESIGQDLIRILAEQLDGEIKFENRQGARIELIFNKNKALSKNS